MIELWNAIIKLGITLRGTIEYWKVINFKMLFVGTDIEQCIVK